MRHRLNYLILLIPVVFYIYTALRWSESPHLGVTGDEPHYLIMAKSIIEDFDLDLKNNYDHDAATSEIFGPIDRHARTFDGKEYGMHLFGLSALIALPLKYFGVLGVKIFMCIISGFIALLAYRIFFNRTGNTNVSLFASLTFSLSLPFLIAAQQVYVEMLTGIICSWSILALYQLFDNKPMSYLLRSLWMVILSFLIFAHIKNVLVVFVICALYFAICLLQVRKETMKTTIYQLSVLAIPLLTVIALQAYLFGITGHLLESPYSSTPLILNLKENLRMFLQYHFDQANGIFLQNPFALIGLVGLIPLFMENKVKGFIFLLVYVPIVFLNCMVLGYFDEANFQSSRFMWGPTILWLIPMSYGLEYIRANYKPEVLNTIFILCITLQLDSFFHWISMSPDSINWQGGYVMFYDAVSMYLPAFRPHVGHLSVNAVYLVGFGLLVLLGSPSGLPVKKFLPGAWTVYFVIFFASLPFAPKPMMKDVVLTAGQLFTTPGEIVTVNEESFWQPTDQSKEGILWSGPYMSLKKGTYEVTFFLNAQPLPGTTGEDLAGIDVCTDGGKKVLASRTIKEADRSFSKFSLEIALQEDTQSAEFRIGKTKNSEIKIKDILIRQTDN